MAIVVTQDIGRGTFPIVVGFNDNDRHQKLTLGAAVELRTKLDAAIGEYLIAAAHKKQEEQSK